MSKELEARKYLIQVNDYGDMCNYIANNQAAYKVIKQALTPIIEELIPYPLTIVADRYNGTYSGGKWLAIKQYCTDVPYEIDSDDVTCHEFWNRTKQTIGKGDTPNEALQDLIYQLNK